MKFVKIEQDYLSVETKSSEPAITMTLEPEKRQRTITKRLSDVVNYDNKKRNATKKRKRNLALSDTVSLHTWHPHLFTAIAHFLW